MSVHDFARLLGCFFLCLLLSHLLLRLILFLYSAFFYFECVYVTLFCCRLYLVRLTAPDSFLVLLRIDYACIFNPSWSLLSASLRSILAYTILVQ